MSRAQAKQVSGGSKGRLIACTDSVMNVHDLLACDDDDEEKEERCDLVSEGLLATRDVIPSLEFCHDIKWDTTKAR